LRFGEKFEIEIGLKFMTKFFLTFLTLLIPLMVNPVAAQLPSAATSKSEKSEQQLPEDPLGRSTPYGTLRSFVIATQRGDYALAARYLDTSKRGTEAEELAKELKIVLDRGLTENIEKSLSRNPEGDLQDELRAGRDLLGIVKTPSGTLNIYLDLIQRPGKIPIWLFSSETLALVPEAAKRTVYFDLEKYFPRPLVQIKIFSFPLYQWIAFILGLAIALGLGTLVTRALVPLLRLSLLRLTGKDDEQTLASIKAPIRLILIAVVFGFFSAFSLSLYNREVWARLGSILVVIAFSWLLILCSSILFKAYESRLRYSQKTGKVAMWGLFSRLFKILVVVVAALWLLKSSGVNLTAILTGLGVGGIAVALAAQKTLENLFGGIMIITDEPIGVGDFCRIDDQMGHIEDIGLRSTRLRTLSRTVVAIPNGQLAAINIENFSKKDKFWLRHLVGLRYETSANQLRYVLAEIRKMLYAHPKVYNDGARIRFVGFGSFSLDLELFAYIIATEMPEFLAIQEDLFLRIMDIVANSGTSIAFPSQTTYLSRDSKLDPQKTEEAEVKVRRWRESGEFPFPEFQLEKVDLMQDRYLKPDTLQW